MSAVVFIGITLIGGLWSSGLANIVSVTLIYIGIIYSAIQSVSNVGGWDAVLSKLPNPEVMGSPVAGLAFATILGWIIVMITQTITAQGPVQIACGAKNAKAARNGYVLAGLMIFPGRLHLRCIGCCLQGNVSGNAGGAGCTCYA